MSGDSDDLEQSAQIFINATFKINTNDFEIAANPFTLKMPTNFCTTAYIDINFEKKDGEIHLAGVAVSQQQISWLKANSGLTHANKFPQFFSGTYETICEELDVLARSAVDYLKYFMGRDQIVDDSISSPVIMKWSVDGDKFYPSPLLFTSFAQMRGQTSLTPKVIAELQKGIDAGIMPFIAMRHLHRAIQGKNTRFKWVDATIAAELAVKEALIRKNPVLEDLIILMPSPPIGVLYGEILRKYLGEVSPYRKKLIEGAETRNKLVHRPEETLITKAKAEEYVNQVTSAINHLYRLLYPEWEISKLMHEKTEFWRNLPTEYRGFPKEHPL